MQETQELRVWPLGWEDPLEVEMATDSSILAWKKSHGQRSLAGYSLQDHKELDTTEQLSTVFTAAVFATANICKQPKCPLTDEWIKKM